MSADFSKLLNHLAENLEEHARRDGLSPVLAAVFLARGGHAPGARCPSEPPGEPIHEMHCDLIVDGEYCTCAVGARQRLPDGLVTGRGLHEADGHARPRSGEHR